LQHQYKLILQCIKHSFMKTDLSKQYKEYYTAKTTPALLSFPAAQYISLVGKGDPNEPQFAANIAAMYGTAYTVKFAYKALNNDFTVPKLECQWWYDELLYPNLTITDAPVNIPRSDWDYRLLLRLPDFATQQMVTDAANTVFNKKAIKEAQQIAYYQLPAMQAVHILHIGPFATEHDSLIILNDYMQQNNLLKDGLHHEIYLSDFRKTAPEKLKTILREPAKKG
jgi:hypothetical protein